MVNKNDKRYISGELVFYRTGTKHKNSTKEKMRKNGIKNRTVYHDENDTLFYLKKMTAKTDLQEDYRMI